MRWFRALSLAALIALPAIAFAGDLEDGRKLLAEGKYEEAAEMFRAVTSADATSLDGWLGLAEAHLGLGNPQGLIDAAERARKIDNKSAIAWMLAGRGNYLLGDFKAAEGGDSSEIRLYYAEAKRCADRALSVDPKTKGANYILAKAALGDTDDPESLTKGIAYYEAETGIAPENADAWFQLGSNVFNGLKDYARAAKAFAGCVVADPNHLLAWKWYGASLEYAKKPNEAVIAYAHAMRVDSSDAYSRGRFYGLAASTKSATEAAIGAYEEIVKAAGDPTPENSFPIRVLGWLYGQAGRHADAIGLLTNLVKELPKDTGSITALGDAYKKKGDLKKAMESWKKAITTDAEAATDAYNRVWGASGADPSTLEWLYSNRENGWIANNLGFLYREAKDYKKSLEWYLKAVELQPNDAGILNDTGVIYHYYMKNKFEIAIGYYDRAIAAAEVQYAKEIAAGQLPIPLRDARNNKAKALRHDASGY